jgi:hypothetical protein
MILAAALAAVLSTAPTARLPDSSRPWYPGQLEQSGPKDIPAANADDAATCGSCHRAIADMWRTSAHAFASFNNPLYRVSVDGVRAGAGPTASRMCGGCHDLALLTQGAMDAKEILPSDVRAHAGVSCTSCHSAVHTTQDGNGSLVLRSDSPFPDRAEDATLARHRERVGAQTLRSPELCGACHRSALDTSTGNAAAFMGMDDWGAWQRSAFNGQLAERPDEPVKPETCRSCHMPREAVGSWDVAAKDGTVPSHRFLGAHTALAAMEHDPAQLARVQKFLVGVVTVDVAAARVNEGEWRFPAERARPAPGDALETDVVVFNAAVGHRFPSGVLDNQQTRLEVELVSATGRVLAASREHELRSEAVSLDGVPLAARETHQIVAAAWNHSVPPRDSRAIRVRFEVPKTLEPSELPLTVRARLTHVSRSTALMESACADSRTERGRAFDIASLAVTEHALDACAEQPVTEVARAEQRLNGEPVSRPDWLRAYHRGQALASGLSEYLGEADEAFQQALAAAPDAPAKGRALFGLGLVAGKRGQVDTANARLDEAQRLLGPVPSIDRARGEAFAQVWRWRPAAQAWRAAARKAPLDLTLWQSLAMAEASAGNAPGALEAAQKGLALNPRDGDCLRVQALVLGQLGAPQPQVAEALAAALHWRTADEAPKAKALCSKNVPGCAARRDPVPKYQATPE